MLYKINSNYYIRIGHYFVEVELIYGDDDIAIKPTNRKVELTNDLVYSETKFLDLREKLLADRKKANKKKSK